MQPLVNVVRWTREPNPNAERRAQFPEVSIAHLSCGHRVNYGGGPALAWTQVKCAECPPVEPRAA